jgi:carbamoylphosphate synthase small subunit
MTDARVATAVVPEDERRPVMPVGSYSDGIAVGGEDALSAPSDSYSATVRAESILLAPSDSHGDTVRAENTLPAPSDSHGVTGREVDTLSASSDSHGDTAVAMEVSPSPRTTTTTTTDEVVVLDYGGQYSQLIARRIRDCGVFSELLPHHVALEQIARRKPRGIVLSGGPASVYADGAPSLDRRLLELGVPVMGI